MDGAGGGGVVGAGGGTKSVTMMASFRRRAADSARPMQLLRRWARTPPLKPGWITDATRSLSDELPLLFVTRVDTPACPGRGGASPYAGLSIPW